MTDVILDEILKIFEPDAPYFYADTFENEHFKMSLLNEIFVSQRIRETIGLTQGAAFKVAYLSKDNTDFLTLKEHQSNCAPSEHYTINFFFFNENIDEIIFDLVIYDNLCLEDLKEDFIDIEHIQTPRLFLFDKDCDLKSI